jgi:hypothetical protein
MSEVFIPETLYDEVVYGVPAFQGLKRWQGPPGSIVSLSRMLIR